MIDANLDASQAMQEAMGEKGAICASIVDHTRGMVLAEAGNCSRSVAPGLYLRSVIRSVVGMVPSRETLTEQRIDERSSRR